MALFLSDTDSGPAYCGLLFNSRPPCWFYCRPAMLAALLSREWLTQLGRVRRSQSIEAGLFLGCCKLAKCLVSPACKLPSGPVHHLNTKKLSPRSFPIDGNRAVGASDGESFTAISHTSSSSSITTAKRSGRSSDQRRRDWWKPFDAPQSFFGLGMRRHALTC